MGINVWLVNKLISKFNHPIVGSKIVGLQDEMGHIVRKGEIYTIVHWIGGNSRTIEIERKDGSNWWSDFDKFRVLKYGDSCDACTSTCKMIKACSLFQKVYSKDPPTPPSVLKLIKEIIRDRWNNLYSNYTEDNPLIQILLFITGIWVALMVCVYLGYRFMG